MNAAERQQYRSCEISDLSAIRAFRRDAHESDPRMSHPIDPTLLSDRWDTISKHLGLLFGNQLVGVVRFSPLLQGELPVHRCAPVPINEYLRNCDAPGEIRELSRALIHPRHRNLIGASIFATAIYKHILTDPAHILVDALVNKSKTRTEGHLLRLGLFDTGMRYWDGRYRSISAIMIGTRDSVVTNIEGYLSS